MAGKVVNIKICGSHQHYFGLSSLSSKNRHYAYTHLSGKLMRDPGSYF